MRSHRPVLLAAPLFATCLALAVPALAQPPMGEGPPPGARREARRDTTLTLGGDYQLWGHAGFGWLGSPTAVRKLYAAGLELGLSGDRRFGDRTGLRARFDFKDLPSTQPSQLAVDGILYDVNVDYGHGWLVTLLAEGTVRPWRNLWLEGGGGIGRFGSGFAGEDFVDLATGTSLPVDARSGWGVAWSAGAHYEFRPTRNDRLLTEFRYQNMDRSGRQLGFFSIRAGYRFR